MEKEKEKITCPKCKRYNLSEEDIVDYKGTEYMVCPVCGSIYLLKPNDTIAMFPGETRFQNKTLIYYAKMGVDFGVYHTKMKHRAWRRMDYASKGKEWGENKND